MLLLDIFITYLYYMCRSIVGSIALFLQRTLLRIGLQKEVFIIFRVYGSSRICSRLSYVFDCKYVNLLSSHTALVLDKHIFEIGLSQILFTVIYCTVRNNIILFLNYFCSKQNMFIAKH